MFYLANFSPSKLRVEGLSPFFRSQKATYSNVSGFFH